MLPVNNYRMITAGACLLTFGTIIIKNWKGLKQALEDRTTDLFLGIFLTPEWFVSASSSPITTQPKSLPPPFPPSPQKTLDSNNHSSRLDPLPALLNVIYALYALSVCVYVCMCVTFFSSACVFPLLAWRWAEPRDWLVVRVMSWWRALSAGMRKAAVLPCSWVSFPPRVRLFVCVPSHQIHPGKKRYCLTCTGLNFVTSTFLLTKECFGYDCL